MQVGAAKFAGQSLGPLQVVVYPLRIVAPVNRFNERPIVTPKGLKIAPVQPAQIFLPVLPVTTEGQPNDLIQFHVEKRFGESGGNTFDGPIFLKIRARPAGVSASSICGSLGIGETEQVVVQEHDVLPVRRHKTGKTTPPAISVGLPLWEPRKTHISWGSPALRTPGHKAVWEYPYPVTRLQHIELRSEYFQG